MSFKLLCNANPATLGIEQANGAWDMREFAKHVLACPKCRRFANALTEEMGEAVDTAPTVPMLPHLNCLRCGHGWTPRKRRVRICPACKSAYFDKPRDAKPGGSA